MPNAPVSTTGGALLGALIANRRWYGLSVYVAEILRFARALHMDFYTPFLHVGCCPLMEQAAVHGRGFASSLVTLYAL